MGYALDKVKTLQKIKKLHLLNKGEKYEWLVKHCEKHKYMSALKYINTITKPVKSVEISKLNLHWRRNFVLWNFHDTKAVISQYMEPRITEL